MLSKKTSPLGKSGNTPFMNRLISVLRVEDSSHKTWFYYQGLVVQSIVSFVSVRDPIHEIYSNGRYCKEVALCKFRPQTDTYYSSRKIVSL